MALSAEAVLKTLINGATNKKGPTASAVDPQSYSQYLRLLEVPRETYPYSAWSSNNTVVLSSTGSCGTLTG